MAKITSAIEANFKLKVSDLSDEEFGIYGSRALWLETYRAELIAGKLAEVLGKLIG